jgi:hypothetical protein
VHTPGTIPQKIRKRIFCERGLGTYSVQLLSADLDDAVLYSSSE